MGGISLFLYNSVLEHPISHFEYFMSLKIDDNYLTRKFNNDLQTTIKESWKFNEQPSKLPTRNQKVSKENLKAVKFCRKSRCNSNVGYPNKTLENLRRNPFIDTALNIVKDTFRRLHEKRYGELRWLFSFTWEDCNGDVVKEIALRKPKYVFPD